MLHLLTLNDCAADAPSVVTVGNFDGLHLGHQQLISSVQQQSLSLQAASTVMLFEPQPLEFLRPEQAPPRLMRLGEKLHGLKQLGVHRVGLVRFTQTFAMLTPQAFVEQLLVDRLRSVAVWVGDDFRFGAQRAGNFSTLCDLAEKHGFSVQQTPTFTLDGQRLSSTWLRSVLQQGDVSQASRILGRAYRIRGRVAHGQKLGRKIGFPTLNIVLKQKPAITGVYAVRVHGLSSSVLMGVANVGSRPTVDGAQNRVEVHVFDWQGDAYGRVVSVEFCQRLRQEQRFADMLALQAQIQLDVVAARSFFSSSVTDLVFC